MPESSVTQKKSGRLANCIGKVQSAGMKALFTRTLTPPPEPTMLNCPTRDWHASSSKKNALLSPLVTLKAIYLAGPFPGVDRGTARFGIVSAMLVQLLGMGSGDTAGKPHRARGGVGCRSQPPIWYPIGPSPSRKGGISNHQSGWYVHVCEGGGGGPGGKVPQQDMGTCSCSAAGDASACSASAFTALAACSCASSSRSRCSAAPSAAVSAVETAAGC